MNKMTGSVRLTVNGHHMQGHKVSGVWRWLIPKFPELALKYSGQPEPFDCVRHFLEIATRLPTTPEVPPRRAG